MTKLEVWRWLIRFVSVVVAIAQMASMPTVSAQNAPQPSPNMQMLEALSKAGKHAEALVIAQRISNIAGRQFGRDSVEFALTLGQMADTQRKLDRDAEAVRNFQREVAILEKDGSIPANILGDRHGNIATILLGLRQNVSAEKHARRAVALMEKAHGRGSDAVAKTTHTLAIILDREGRYANAEPLARRALENWTKIHGAGSGAAANAANTLAGILVALDRHAEAEPLARRVADIWKAEHGAESGAYANALNTLVVVLRARGRSAEAEPIAREVLRVWQNESGGSESDAVGNASNTLAAILNGTGRNAEAEPFARLTVRVWDGVHGANSDAAANARNTLALILGSLGRQDEALQTAEAALAIWRRAHGDRHRAVASGSTNLAAQYFARGDLDRAIQLWEAAVAIWSGVDGPDHHSNAPALIGITSAHFAKSDWARAYASGGRALEMAVDSVRRNMIPLGAALAGDTGQTTASTGGQPIVVIKSAHRLAPEASDRRRDLALPTFETAQWAYNSAAGISLTQMATRVAAGEPALASLIRERQDRVVEWQAKDKKLLSLQVSHAPTDGTAQTALRGETAKIASRVASIDVTLKQRFPRYMALGNPEVTTVVELQDVILNNNEALLLILDTSAMGATSEETFVWIVTKTDVRWVRSALGTSALTREVAALRCGLDRTAWHGDGLRRCADLLNKPSAKAPAVVEPLPFDHARAHALYKGLFSEVEDLIKGKQLLIVPSGALTQLPFQVLVTEPPKSGGDNRTIAWLARDHAITVLPAVSSLKTLRRVSKPSAAPRPFIGFGNPLLDGDKGNEHVQLAKQARDHKGCAETPLQRTASMRGMVRSLAPLPQTSGLASLEHVRSQSPLPDTADELCVVARNLKADVGEIRLGARATEREIKSLSASGKLAQFRILHFATHGALAGELSGSAEPGLILTPPDKAAEEDDGYLSASEIAALKLDADWVILSACNTAGGAGKGEAAEALSGLARAFFYAQARALLVSHWAVNSATTVQLVTTAVGELAADPKIGRGEALRRAMLWMIDKGEPHEAHPAYWAPFVVVGEGGAGR